MRHETDLIIKLQTSLSVVMMSQCSDYMGGSDPDRPFEDAGDVLADQARQWQTDPVDVRRSDRFWHWAKSRSSGLAGHHLFDKSHLYVWITGFIRTLSPLGWTSHLSVMSFLRSLEAERGHLTPERLRITRMTLTSRLAPHRY